MTREEAERVVRAVLGNTHLTTVLPPGATVKGVAEHIVEALILNGLKLPQAVR